ncbi:MAG: YggS family pyridoxal phosphate-dependent enzyme [Oscillospiraceae bacterium]|nr:YggS family pyridoxal phosphate-dependent enzyme [Oscillospiraceae bacterium]
MRMVNDLSFVRENYARIREAAADAAIRSGRKPEDVALMAVTKTVDPVLVNCAIDCGIRLLGENRVQEYQSKREQYNPEAQVHFIGHLQTNKVKYLVGNVTMIQSVDRMSLAGEINRCAEKHGIRQDILLEVNIGGEESKSGVQPEALRALLESVAALPHVHVCGLMTIPPPCEDTRYLEAMRSLFEQMKECGVQGTDMNILSMGMSGDFEQAIACGSNLVRIGSALFGARHYQ